MQAMNRDDLAAIYRYLRALGPAGSPAPPPSARASRSPPRTSSSFPTPTSAKTSLR
jgi:hypothetical protein